MKTETGAWVAVAAVEVEVEDVIDTHKTVIEVNWKAKASRHLHMARHRDKITRSDQDTSFAD